MSLELEFLGSGDAFGSGGRNQACILLTGPSGRLLLDFGASSLIAMNRAGIDPSSIDWILISHLHGDHFGGLPFLILNDRFAGRTAPLAIGGPPGLQQRLEATMEVLFPGSPPASGRFPVDCIELRPGVRTRFGPSWVTPFDVEHASGAPSFGLRVEMDGRVVGYSGDTEWTENLVSIARGTDLFVSEAYFLEKRVRFHLDYRTLRKHLDELQSRRVVLTHMSRDLLERIDEIDTEFAYDGLKLTL